MTQNSIANPAETHHNTHPTQSHNFIPCPTSPKRIHQPTAGTIRQPAHVSTKPPTEQRNSKYI